MRRLPLAAALVAGVLALTGCAGLSMSGGSTSSPSAPYTSPTLKVAKPAPWTAPLTIAPSTGTFTSVMVTDTATRYQLMGSIVNNGASWTSESRPAAGGSYSITAVVVDGDHTSTVKSKVGIASQPASATMKYDFEPGATLPVGAFAPIVIRFNHPVTQRAAVEQALEVSTSTPVVGAWHWIGSTELHFRPEVSWPAHSTVRLRALFDGLKMNDTRYGARDVNYSFTIGDKHETVVNDVTHTFVMKINDKVAYSWTTSLGKPLYETRTGNYIVLEKDKLREMTSCAAQITCNKADPQYYDLQVQWDTRLTWSGTFVHGAPWDSHLGFADVSHGCIHLTLTNAETFFNLAQYGDMVRVLHTSRPIDDLIAAHDPGASDWNSTWDAWVAGSALQAPVTTTALS